MKLSNRSSSAWSLSPPTTGTEFDPGEAVWVNPELRAGAAMTDRHGLL